MQLIFVLYYNMRKNVQWRYCNVAYREFYEKIERVRAETGLAEREPMKKHTTFQIGGEADVFVQPRTLSAFMQVLTAARAAEVPLTMLGRGSNLLVSDEGIEGIVLCTCGINGVRVDGNRIRAEAGATLAQVAHAAWKAGLTGAEFAAGIPGTVGGGVFMNAGAYGGQLADLITRSVYMDENSAVRVLPGAAHQFGYRMSVFKSHPKWAIMETEFQLQPGDPAEIRVKMDDFARRRREKQPLNFPSAGSTFKRPEGYFAGRLIEDAGLKGVFVGGAQVSEKHAGFVINQGGATCQDVMALISKIQQTIHEKFGVQLECEVRRIGRGGE